MLNFNNERMSMAVGACRMARCCLEDAIRPLRLGFPAWIEPIEVMTPVFLILFSSPKAIFRGILDP